MQIRPGLIPARAGNTVPVNVTTSPWRAHPRSRGEHEEKPPHPQNHPGSSPLARGTHRRGYSSPRVRGLIPARAGNTLAPILTHGSTRAHPRSRGEHRQVPVGAPAIMGSSPLARGTRARARPRTTGCRLIPARAGNTCRPPRSSSRPRAHPRSRGEHINYLGGGPWPTGSSPLARGTRYRRHDLTIRAGLIPARAGNTS